MPQAGTPTVVHPGVAAVLSSPIGPAAGQSWSVEIDNLTPWQLNVTMPGQAASSLAPGTAQLYYARTGPATVTVTPVGAAFDTGAYQILTNWAQGADIIPGTFPVVISPVLAAAAVVEGSAEVFTWTGGQAGTNSPIALPSGYRYLAIVWQYQNNSGATPANVTVEIVGATTGVLYGLDSNSAIPPGGFYRHLFYVPIEQALDPTVDFVFGSIGGSGSDTAKAWVAADVSAPLAQTFALDGQGSGSSVLTYPGLGESAAFVGTGQISVAAGPAVTLIAAPAAGTFNRVRNIHLHAATTAASTAQLAIVQTASTTTEIVVQYAQANGISYTWTGDLPITEGLQVVTNLAVSAGASAHYRNEPIVQI